MPSSRSQFASVAFRLGGLGLLILGLSPVARASDSAPRVTAPDVACAPRDAGLPDLTPDLWRLVGGDAARAYPYDPARFIGPPVPLAILFAPAIAPVAAGMRIELEPGAAPVATRGVAPPPEPVIRYADVFDRLTPVRHADGSLSIDLTGIFMTDVEAWIDADGVHVAEPGETLPVVR